MQPFPVICETCHARLKVRSETVIGQILACPKCGSMVQIVPPADWSAADDPQSTAPEPTVQPPLALAAWLSGPIALWAGGGATVLLAATLVGVLWVRGDSDDAPPIHAPTPAVEATATAVEESVPRASHDEASLVADAPNHKPTATELAATAPPSVDEASIAETVEAITAPPAATLAAAEPQPPISKPEPAEVDPPKLTLGTQQAIEPQPSSNSAGDKNPSSSVLAPHSSLLDPQNSLLDPQAAVRLGPMSSQSLRSRDVAEQLALPIKSLDMPRVPLARMIEMLSDMAAVPITLDPAALSMAGIAATEEVNVEARDTTVAALLADALAKHGLEYAEQGGQLIVVKPNADRRRSVDYELKDLVEPGNADAARLAELVGQFVDPASWKAAGGTGQIEVDGTTLRIEQTDRVHYQILTFCERLRLARELPLRSRYPADRLTIEPLYPQLESQLVKSATFTFLPWTRLADVFRHWQEATGVTVLVDWSALAQQELGPSSPVACSIVDRPWDEALDTILAPLGLAWWAVDGRTIQITSREAAVRRQQVEFYPVAKDALEQYPSPAAFTAALERELLSQLGVDAQDGPQFRIAFDPPSGRLIVLGSPDVQRYLASRRDGLEPPRHERH